MMNCEFKKGYMWLLLMPFILEGCWDSSVDYRQIESSTSTSTSTSTIDHSTIKYLTVGGSGSVFSSPDGISWIERTSVTSNSLNDVAYQKHEFYPNGLYYSVESQPLEVNNWYHEAGIYDNGEQRMYINGELIDEDFVVSKINEA